MKLLAKVFERLSAAADKAGPVATILLFLLLIFGGTMVAAVYVLHRDAVLPLVNEGRETLKVQRDESIKQSKLMGNMLQIMSDQKRRDEDRMEGDERRNVLLEELIKAWREGKN